MTGLWDIHNHMLPGLDDGSSCMDETFDLLQDAYKQGVRNIIFTPHYRKNMFEISIEERQKVFAEFLTLYQNKWSREIPDMTFQLGCEFHMHPSYELVLLNEEEYRMPGDKVILAEFIKGDSLYKIKHILEPFLEEGYRCIIAHSERYGLKYEEIRRLRAMKGVTIQINADSLLGLDGFKIKLLTRKLLREGCIDLIGSDAHDTDERPCNLGRCADWICKKYGENVARTLFITNPERVFNKDE